MKIILETPEDRRNARGLVDLLRDERIQQLATAHYSGYATGPLADALETAKAEYDRRHP